MIVKAAFGNSTILRLSAAASFCFWPACAMPGQAAGLLDGFAYAVFVASGANTYQLFFLAWFWDTSVRQIDAAGGSIYVIIVLECEHCRS